MSSLALTGAAAMPCLSCSREGETEGEFAVADLIAISVRLSRYDSILSNSPRWFSSLAIVGRVPSVGVEIITCADWLADCLCSAR